MSAAVKAALAARRAAHRSRSTSPTKPTLDLPTNSGETAPLSSLGQRPSFAEELDPSISSPFGSPKPRGRTLGKDPAMDNTPVEGLQLTQKPLDEIVRKSIESGRVNLASRSPSLTQLPAELLSLLSDDPPSWFQAIPDDERGPWYAREELNTLQLGTNELHEVDPRLAEFRGLGRLELQNNRLVSLPPSLFQLTVLTTLNLSNNGLTAVPTCLLAIDSLVTLNLSNNRIKTLWDGAAVLRARGEREQRDKDQGESDSVWSGLSSNKRAAPEQKKTHAKELPMTGLRTLDLSNNKIDNAALGVPDVSRRKVASAAPDAEVAPVRLPPTLKKLDLGSNFLRGPLPIAAFAQLPDLEDLGLQGSGIGDDVFWTDKAESTPSAVTTTFSALTTLDLSRCEIDDLAGIEGLFGSKRIKSVDAALSSEEDVGAPHADGLNEAAAGIAARQLVRTSNRLTQSEIDKMEKRHGKVLCVLLDGNPLREEAYRQKRGGRGSGSPLKHANASGPGSDPTAALLAQDPAIASLSRTASPAVPSTPGKSGPAKEEWELLAEAGLNTEAGRRKQRIEQARREREAAEAAGSTVLQAGEAPSEGENILHQFLQGRTGARTAGDGVNKTGLSDWDGEPSPSRPNRHSKDRGTSQQRSNSDEAADKDTGSALANAKLSTKKKEALGQVPCKFFRSNGCSAGSSCPFAHTLPGDGQQKATCQWFLKGSCRFGHKCALAHVLPGQPMSMDRKNKRAAQHGQPLPVVPGQLVQGVGVAHQSPSAPNRTQQNELPQQLLPSQMQASKLQMPQQQPQMLAPQASQAQQHAQQQQQHQQQLQPQDHSTIRLGSFSGRDHELPFGLPDDLQAMSPPNGGSRLPIDGLHHPLTPNGHRASSQSRDQTATSQHGASLLGELDRAGSFSSAQRPLSVPRTAGTSSLGAIRADQGGMGIDGHAIGSPPTARAFGTSPFSHPGGHGLFFSGSQDSEGGAGPFARSGRDSLFGARSVGRMDDAAAKAKWWNSLGSTGPDEADEDGEDGGAEDFLPSSLSDLLTPAELERRRRSSRMSASLGGKEDRMIPQSLPTQVGTQLGSSLLDFGLGSGRRPVGAERGSREPTKSSNISTGFLQRKQGETGSGDSHGYKPFGERRYSSGLDGIALNEASGAASSPGRANLHAPGQSLPQGLAAGLSRLHLMSGRGPESGLASGGNGNMTGTTSGLAAQPAQSSSLRSLGAGLNDYELGPTAPSSVLPHRSPLGMAIGGGSTRLSGAFGSPGTIGSAAHFSPSSFGARRPASGAHFGGEAASLESDTARPPSSQPIGAAGTRPHQHPGMQRLRPSSSSITPHSPLTLPEFTHEEVEEEAIFELE